MVIALWGVIFQWVQTIGADGVLNYKNYSTLAQMKDALFQACPNGVDVYFGKGMHSTAFSGLGI